MGKTGIEDFLLLLFDVVAVGEDRRFLLGWVELTTSVDSPEETSSSSSADEFEEDEPEAEILSLRKIFMSRSAASSAS